jgi:hypothetical protein
MATSPTNYRLPDDVYLATTEDGAVFLDVRRDSYSGLSGDQLGPLRQVIAAATLTDAAAIALADQLVELQLLTTTDHSSRPIAPHVLPTPSGMLVDIYASDAAGAWTIGQLTDLIAACLYVTYALRARSLEQIVHRVRSRKAAQQRQPASSDDPASLEQLVTAFHRLRPVLYVATDRCIFDSLVLVEFLARRQFFPMWVFGVKTGPFHAHSWVQHECCVLNDFPEHVRGYAPILVV